MVKMFKALDLKRLLVEYVPEDNALPMSAGKLLESSGTINVLKGSCITINTFCKKKRSEV